MSSPSPTTTTTQLATIPEFTPKQELVLRELLAQALPERDAARAALADAKAEVDELKARIKAVGCGCIGESGWVGPSSYCTHDMR